MSHRSCQSDADQQLTGYIFCFSQAGVPTLKIAPVNVLVHEFKTMYNIGKSTSPLIAISVTLCNAYSAYESKDAIGGVLSPFIYYLAATLCVPCIVPYTLLVMEPMVNKRLLTLGSMAERGVKAEGFTSEEDDVREKLIRWKAMNFVRAAIVGVGALLALLGTMA